MPKIESWHRLIKDRARCYRAMLPFNSLLRMMAMHLMKTVVFYVPGFVQRRGVYQIMPPLTIVEGTVLYFNLHFRVIFGEFLKTFEGSDSTMTPRTIDDIALGPNVNFQGGVR